MLHLLIDNREHKLIDTIKNKFDEPFTFKKTQGILTCATDQLAIGDYILVTLIKNENELIPDKTLAVFERKTLKDYNASFKDGRCNNKEKLLKMRELTGCKIFYIIEGPLNPDLDTKFAGIKYRSTLASIYNLQINDNIFIIRTQNKSHTACELRLISEMYLRNITNPDSPLCKEFSGATENTYEETISKSKLTPEEEFRKSVISGWATLKGISLNIAAKIACEYSFIQWIRGEIICSEFKINGRANNKVPEYLNTKPTEEQIQAIISCVRGISKKTSAEIFAKIDSKYFLNEYKAFTYGQKSTKFTKKKYDDCIKYLNACLTP